MNMILYIHKKATGFIFIFVIYVHIFLMKRICHLNNGSYIPSHEADSILLDKRGMHFLKVCQFMKFSSV